MQHKECIPYASKVKHFESQTNLTSRTAVRCSCDVIYVSSRLISHFELNIFNKLEYSLAEIQPILLSFAVNFSFLQKDYTKARFYDLIFSAHHAILLYTARIHTITLPYLKSARKVSIVSIFSLRFFS